MKLVDKNRVYDGYLKIDNLSVQYKSGNTHSREVMVKDNAVCALIYDKNIDKYVLVKQWRPASEDQVIEIVAGTLDIPNEDTVDALKREVLEETGYLVDSTELIGSCFVSPGCTTEFLSVFYCEVSNKVESGGGVHDEDIEIIYLTKEELLKLKSNDMKTLLSIMYIKTKL